MARKRAGTLREQLADLVGQRDQLQGRMVELEQERDELDVANAKSAVDRLQEIGSELDAVKRVLPALNAKIGAVQLRAAQEQSVEDRATVERLWSTEHEQMEGIEELVDQLAAACSAVMETQRQIASLGGLRKGNLAGLPAFVRQVKNSWRVAGLVHGEGSMHDRTPAPQPKVELPPERRGGEVVRYKLPKEDDPDPRSWTRV